MDGLIGPLTAAVQAGMRVALDYNSQQPKPLQISPLSRMIQAVMKFFGLSAFIGFHRDLD